MLLKVVNDNTHSMSPYQVISTPPPLAGAAEGSPQSHSFHSCLSPLPPSQVLLKVVHDFLQQLGEAQPGEHDQHQMAATLLQAAAGARSTRQAEREKRKRRLAAFMKAQVTISIELAYRFNATSGRGDGDVWVMSGMGGRGGGVGVDSGEQ